MDFDVRGKLWVIYFAVLKLLEKKLECISSLLTSSQRMTEIRGSLCNVLTECGVTK